MPRTHAPEEHPLAAGEAEPRPDAGGLEPSVTGGSNLDEEVRRLRRENADLRRRLGGRVPRAPARSGWRSPVVALLLVVVWVLTPLSIAGVWLRNQLIDEETYVETVAPLSSDPAVQSAVANFVTAQIFDNLDVEGVARQALPPRLEFLAQPLTTQVQAFTASQVLKAVQTHQFTVMWAGINRAAHQQVVNFLLDRPGAVTLANGKVVLELGAVITLAQKQLEDAGLGIVGRIPADKIHKQFVIADADALVKARRQIRLVQGMTAILPFLTLGLLALAVYLSPRRRRTLLIGAVGMSAATVVLAVSLNLARTAYIDQVSSPQLPSDAAAAVFDTIVRFLRNGIRTVFTVSLVVALAAFLAGPAGVAVWVRSHARAALVGARDWAERKGWKSGPVGVWIGAHKALLRIVVTGLAAILLVFLERPGPGTVVAITIALAVALAVIEFLGRERARGSPSGAGRRRPHGGAGAQSRRAA